MKVAKELVKHSILLLAAFVVADIILAGTQSAQLSVYPAVRVVTALFLWAIYVLWDWSRSK